MHVLEAELVIGELRVPTGGFRLSGHASRDLRWRALCTSTSHSTIAVDLLQRELVARRSGKEH